LAALKIEQKMKKLGLFILAGGLLLGGCKETEPTSSNDTYPTDALTVDAKQRVLVVEQTGAWCQFCPNGAEKMIALDAFLGDAILPIAVHNKDDLTLPVSGLWDDNYPTQGVPNFYVMNEDAGLSPEGKIPAYINLVPTLGVNHAVVTTDTSYNVYAKIEVFTDSYNEDYLINSYLILDGVLAKDYGGGLDLNQVSSVPIVQTGAGSTPTKWAQNAAVVNGEPQVKAGDNYDHIEVLFTPANTANPWGLPLAEVNPFGRDFIEGDILGTKNTPILLSIPKTSLAPFETGLSVATIVWRLRTDGSGGYDYVNGYMSHFSNTN